MHGKSKYPPFCEQRYWHRRYATVNGVVGRYARHKMVGAALGFILCGAVSLAVIAARRITLQSMISFGPFILASAPLAALASAR